MRPPCRAPEIERFIRSVGAEKRVVLLLNKIDLVPREAVEAWLTYLREELPTVAFKCSTQQQAANLKQGAGPARRGRAGKGGAAADGTGSECLGAETLLQLLKNYARSRDMKTSITGEDGMQPAR